MSRTTALRALRIALFLASSALPGVAHASLVLDQQFVASENTDARMTRASDATFRRVQTVTAGLSGTLQLIEIQVSQTYAYSGFNILATSSGVPTSTILGTASYTGTSGGWASFTSSLSMSAGDIFGLEPVATVAGTAWIDSVAGGYAGGSDYYLNTLFAINSLTSSGFDNGFRTYVDVPAGVPEPSTWAMMLVGFGAIGFAMRRRKPEVAIRRGA